ncbi:PD40 domain-containing protein [Flagellimonas pacifica]|uniref:WD40-like Beta Propeller Repeat n=1 Tax=Flagellimonas pacifica TaxID=1247520 RepID=A0A285MUC8_9FLAO|nr:PD40 domain-containing protein [Allomuricauda parva]SNZ00728.1 WD40-like Beta Propeller Repeat [Allomuricauda parva]
MTRSLTYSLTLIIGLFCTAPITAQNAIKFENTNVDTQDSNNNGRLSTLEGYIPSISVTEDGKTAYFSKSSEQKPLYGLFSKKELLHEIYRAEKINGKWSNITKLKVCPKYASAKHPTVSEDGKRLFFASNMKGSYGKYDIYVADISADGSLGVSKNLGPKVNTKEDELYPSIYNSTLLFFASEGRDGFGGLDLYASQVAHNSLTTSVNLGSHINSSRDDYAIQLDVEKGESYVVSNRGQNHTIEQVTIAYRRQTMDGTMVAYSDENLKTALNTGTSYEYTSTSFED